MSSQNSQFKIRQPVRAVVEEIHPFGVSANAPHPNAARLFVDFILSKEGQQMIASFFRVPTRTDVSAIVPRMKKGLNLVPWDSSMVDSYEKNVNLYRKVLMKN